MALAGWANPRNWPYPPGCGESRRARRFLENVATSAALSARAVRARDWGGAPLAQLLLAFLCVCSASWLPSGSRARDPQHHRHLRNRLIAAYVFIAVVPVVLILLLAGLATYFVIGQMAVYLVSTELEHRQWMLMHSAKALARVPITDPTTALGRFESVTRAAFPDFALLVSGRRVRYPSNTAISHPPTEWKRASGLIVEPEGGKDRLFAWAHRGQERQRSDGAGSGDDGGHGGLMPGFGGVASCPRSG